MNSPRSSHSEATTPLSLQAAHWWVTLHSDDCTQNDRREFAGWVSQSPERVQAYLRMVSAMRALGGAQVSWPATPVETLIREARGERNIEPLAVRGARAPERRRRPPILRWASGLAAALVLVAGVLLLADSPQRFRTGVGEQLSVRLGDGSLLTLNTASSVEVRFDSRRRSVQLLSGEALFEVAHEPARAFEVTAGPAQIRAVGTEFNVNRRDTGTTVTVLEGRVIVSAADGSSGKSGKALSSAAGAAAPLSLSAADRLVMADSRTVAVDRVGDLAAVKAWTQRRLVFENRPLGEIADEFNRFNRTKIRIEDDALRGQAVTGVFQADDPQSFLAFIAQIPGATIREIDGVSTIEVKKVASGGGPD